MIRKFLSILVLILVVSPLMMKPNTISSIDRPRFNDDDDISDTMVGPYDDVIPNPSDGMQLANGMSTGVADPLTIERQGYYATGNISARTDTNENTHQNLLIDTGNNWKGSRAEVEVMDLATLYAVNGTYDEGIIGTYPNPNATNPTPYFPYGWDATSNSTDEGQTQRVAYDSASFIVVENEGTKIGPSGRKYTHFAGTSIVWNQTIENIPTVDDFVLSFDYLYLRGVLGYANFTGNCTLNVFLDRARVYNVSLPALASRGEWYETGDIPITITDAPESFELMIGLVIDETLALNADNDYNGDSIEEGISNTVYITAYMDNLRFISANAPSFESVDLQFHADTSIEPIVGSSGVGSAQISNPLYWESSEIPVSVSSNKTIAFTYESRLLSHRFSNSSYANDMDKEGVSFEVNHGESTEVVAFTYLGSLIGYEENSLFVYYPTDWDNETILDPFLNDITSQCSFFSNYFSIPESALSYFGWYEIVIESPNYAQDIDVQIFDSGWTSGTIFRPTNETRPVISIQTQTEIPSTLNNVNITWYVPNGTIWYDEFISGGSAGVIQGTSKILDSSHAGAWEIEIFWSNGTAIAYDISSFDVYHSAKLIADPAVIETDAGQIVTGIVQYSDLDTGFYITDALTTISGNWSASTKYFVAIPANNWWQVSLDTSEIGAGTFIVHVDASRPYYDAASCDILIISTNVTRLDSPNAPWTSAQWGSEISLTFNFEVYDIGTETWGPVTNNSDVSASLNWTAGYWNVVEDATPGIYLVNVDTSAQPSGTYLLNATFEKPDHESKDLLLTLIVSPIASSLVVLGDLSARVNISDDYSLKMKFIDQSEVPIPSASVVVDSVTPPTGLTHTTVDGVGGEPGNYSVTLTPNAAGVFAIRFVATESNSEPASTVFILVVNDVQTMLVVLGGNSFEIGLTDVFNTTFTYKTADYTGIDNASISIIYSGNTGGISWDLAEHSLGEYSVEFSATLSGTYVVTIAAFKQYYQSASDSFFLVVRDITTNFTVMNGTAGIISYGQDYRMVLSYVNGSGVGLVGADISIESIVPETGLSKGDPVPGAPGIYSILLTPTISNTFTLLVRASLVNHQVQFVRFTITATAIASSLTILNTSSTIAFDQNYTVFVHYQSEYLTGLENANLSIQNPPSEVGHTTFEELGDGLYKVTLIPHAIGIFDLVFRAELTGYQSDTAGFALSASRIQTDLRFESGLSSDTVEYLQTSEFVVLFERTDFNQSILGADISILTSPTTGLEWTFHEDTGIYHIEIEPGHVGRWTITISASKTGYALGSIQFILDVEPVRISAQLLSQPSAVEGVEFPIEISLTHEGSTTPVTGALVEFRITAAGSPLGTYETMEETDTPGVYRSTFTFPLYQSISEYELEIRVNKDNYEMSGGSFTSPFSKSEDVVLRMVPVATGSGLLLAVLIGSVVGIRLMNTRKKRKNLEALQVKKRFDDVSNILGIITLHKKTGLPVYSKMIKGGFEEAMVSAFITAITHFRSEFEMDEKHWDFNVFPISDIISAVPTRSLIVAFITVRPPSKYQASAMEAFGRAIGALYDEILADTKVGFVDPSQTEIFDTLFYDLLDGILIEKFRTTGDASFPKSMQCLEVAAQQLENGEGFKLEDLARGIATCGIEESRAYKIVMDAIDSKLIEVAPDNDSEVVPPPPNESDIRETIDDEDELPM
ncbi:MAG: hypothetical protein RTV31_03400 [Candidatus Thorarchaeota archaeon]